MGRGTTGKKGVVQGGRGRLTRIVDQGSKDRRPVKNKPSTSLGKNLLRGKGGMGRRRKVRWGKTEEKGEKWTANREKLDRNPKTKK